jgi:hypothetical protein
VFTIEELASGLPFHGRRDYGRVLVGKKCRVGSPSRRNLIFIPTTIAVNRIGLFWDRCYDFKKYFCRNFCENIGVFAQTVATFCKKFDHNIGF